MKVLKFRYLPKKQNNITGIHSQPSFKRIHPRPCRQRPPVQVEGSDRPVQRSADDDEAAGGEGDVSDAAGVFGKCDKAEAGVGVPHFHLQEFINTVWSQRRDLESSFIWY